MFSTPGLIVELVGIGIVLLGWLLFRRPGVAFLTYGPIWRAGEYLRPPGVALWVLGLLVAWVGVVMLFARIGA
jgi:hypothetical protein